MLAVRYGLWARSSKPMAHGSRQGITNMIVPMKKIYLVMQQKEAPEALETLRQVGVVHVENEKIPGGERMARLKEEVNLLENALAIIKSGRQKASPLKDGNPILKARELLELADAKDKLAGQIQSLRAEIRFWEPWGDFDPEDIRALVQRGLHVQLYEILSKDLKKVVSDVVPEVISIKDGVARCAVISSEKISLSFPCVALPSVSLKEMLFHQQEDLCQKAVVESRIREFSRYRESLTRALDEGRARLNFQEVLEGMGQEGPLAYLKGFLPKESCEILTTMAREKGWGVIITDPFSDDKVPTLLRNPKWVEIIKPMFSVMNLLPGYRERDISLPFLVFFSIFFGILVGDAGYGLIFLGMSVFAHRRFAGRMTDRSPFILGYVLSSAAILWGILTGTFFGTALFKGLKPFLPWLTDIENLQMLCLFIGAIHLTLAHVWRLIMKIPDMTAVLSEIGWIAIVWGMYFFANTIIVGLDLVGSGKFFLVGLGVVAVMIDILKQAKDVGVSLILLIFSVIGAFTDVVSYIRLFAVGFATVAVADAFNHMALGVGVQNVGTAIVAGLILAFVHLFLNLLLCLLGVLVHGVRLNVLEFSSHLNMEWSGIQYDPFRELKQANT